MQCIFLDISFNLALLLRSSCYFVSFVYCFYIFCLYCRFVYFWWMSATLFWSVVSVEHFSGPCQTSLHTSECIVVRHLLKRTTVTSLFITWLLPVKKKLSLFSHLPPQMIHRIKRHCIKIRKETRQIQKVGIHAKRKDYFRIIIYIGSSWSSVVGFLLLTSSVQHMLLTRIPATLSHM